MKLLCRNVKSVVMVLILMVLGLGGILTNNVYAEDGNDDQCYALKYTHNGQNLITNRICRTSDGTPYQPSVSGVDLATTGNNPKFSVNTAGLGTGKGAILLAVNGQENLGSTNVTDDRALSGDLLLEVIRKACHTDELTCGDYKFSGEVVSAAKNDETWKTVTQVEAPETTDEDSDGVGSCAGSGAGGSLGWILCPILENLSSAAENVYTDYVEPALQMKASLFSDEGDNGGVRTAWEAFRNMANIAFIILLLVVIFSQLTGVGIDNYGIKKILPKLIVAAVLINLSYLICVIAVDLSNVIGGGLQSLFDNLPPNEFTAKLENSSDYVIKPGVGKTIVSVGLIGLLGAGAGLAIIKNPAVLLSLLVAALGIVVAIFFLFVLLAAREAAVVVLTVISPLAFICFMLPNTKKLFDKWLKFGQGLLLLYPICGLLVGGGDYVSRLVLAAQSGNVGFMTSLTAMLIGVAPIFFIPSVIKGSFSAMGKMGATITNLGNRARGASTRAMQNSGVYKTAQERGIERRARINAGVGADGKPLKNISAVGRLMRGGNRNIARSRAQYLSDQEKRRQEQNLLGGGFEAGLAGVDAKLDAQRTSNAEAMIGYGRATYEARDENGQIIRDENGQAVMKVANSGDMDSMQEYHASALRKYQSAKDSNERAAAAAEIRAAQNIMAKTGGGRDRIYENLKNAAKDEGSRAGLSLAASHLQSNFGETFKSKNRGSNELIGDLASGRSFDGDDGVLQRSKNHHYDTFGTDKYDQESLVNADNSALERMASAFPEKADVPVTDGKLLQMRGTALKSLEMYESGKLSIKPEVLRHIERMAGRSVIQPGAGAGTGAGAGSGDAGHAT